MKGFIYADDEGTFDRELYLNKDTNGIWRVISAESAKEAPESTKKEIASFVRPSWKLAAYVEKMTYDLNLMGMRTTKIEATIEATLKYYLKKLSFMDLEFEVDDEGFNHIKTDQWESMVNEGGLSPNIIIGLFDAYREVSQI